MREVNGALSRRGWGGAGVQCGLCASSLRLRAGEESAVTGLGATRPASHSLLRPPPLLQPPPRARGRPRHPNSAAFPAHTPGTARPVPQPPARRGGVLPKEDGPRRSPSFRTPAAGGPPLRPAAAALRASPSPPGSYLPGGSARLGSAAAARLLGPRERRRRRRRGEPGAPPRLQTQRRPLDPGTRVCAGPRAHGDRAAGQRPRPRAYRAGGSARRRCWRSVRDSDTKATRDLWCAPGPASAGRLQPLRRSSSLRTPLATARSLPHQRRSGRRSSRFSTWFHVYSNDRVRLGRCRVLLPPPGLY